MSAPNQTHQTHQTKPLPHPPAHRPPVPPRTGRRPLPPVPGNHAPAPDTGTGAAPDTGTVRPIAWNDGRPTQTGTPRLPVLGNRPPIGAAPSPDGTDNQIVTRRPLPPTPTKRTLANPSLINATPPGRTPPPRPPRRDLPGRPAVVRATVTTTTPTNQAPSTPAAAPVVGPADAVLGNRRRGGPVVIQPLPPTIDLAHASPNATNQVALAVRPEHADKVFDLFESVRRSGRGTMRTTDLIDLLNRAGDLVDNIGNGLTVVKVLDPESELALRYIAGDKAKANLRKKLTTKREKGLFGERARALDDYLTENPKLAAYLNARKITVQFNSGQAANYGEGLFIDNTVHLGYLSAVRPDTFLRLFLHETGHATFQRLVVPHQQQTNGESHIPDVMNNGRAGELWDTRDKVLEQLRTVAATAVGSDNPDLSTLDRADPRFGGLITQLEDIEQELARENVKTIWDSWGPDAQTLYRAWLVLRTNNGQHLMGVDLELGRDPAARRSYQAGKFSEFCAETFMGYATGLLADHLSDLKTNKSATPEVDAAWAGVVRILDKYVPGRIIGR
jgi:hypothetical protein